MDTEGRYVVDSNGSDVWGYADETFDTREQAIENAPLVLSLCPGETFYSGRLQWFAPPAPDADDHLERVAERAVEVAGDAADDYPVVTHAEGERLQTLLNDAWAKWLDEVKPTRLMVIVDIQTHTVPSEEELKAAYEALNPPAPDRDLILIDITGYVREVLTQPLPTAEQPAAHPNEKVCPECECRFIPTDPRDEWCQKCGLSEFLSSQGD